MMKSKKNGKPKLFCPVCLSTEISDFIGFISAGYKCKNCGYVGNFFLENYVIGKEHKKNRKDI